MDRKNRILALLKAGLLSFVFFALMPVTVPAFAQASIKVEAPNIVGADEQFNVTFIIEGEDRPTEFIWDKGEDFDLVWGPQQGSSTSVSIVNGKRTKSSQFTYIYILRPKRTGQCVIPSAVAKFKNKEAASSPKSVKVLEQGSSTSSQQSSGSASSGGGSQTTGSISSDDLYLSLKLSRTDVVLGEPVTAELKLYQRVGIAGFEGARFPSFNGFWSQETAAPINIEFEREDVGGQLYNSALLRRYVLIPQQTGKLTIEPAELICLVNVRTASRTGNSIFDSFFDDGYTTVRKRINSRPVTVNVRELPAGAPAGFGGGVGQFRISASLSKNELKAHEAGSLIVTVSGRGNLSLLEAPELKFPPDFEVYDVKSTTNADKSTGGTTGSRVFEYPFIPRSHGDFTIGPVMYSYYDVNAGKYVTISSDALELSVEKGSVQSQEGQAVQTPSAERKDVKNLGEDIRFIVRDLPKYSFGRTFIVNSLGFWLAFVLLSLAAAAAWLVFRGMAARKADVAGTRTRRATKMALARLKTASGYLRQNLGAAFYEELHRALLGYISDKLNIGVEDLNKENISSRLLEGGVAQDLVDSYISLVDACEYARYSPDSGNEAMTTHYNEAVRIISSIDSTMKSHKKTAYGAMSLIVLMLVLPAVMRAENQNALLDSLWQNGVSAYSDGRWEESADAWESLRGAGVESAELYYNLGNAYFKSTEIGRAVLNYERALRIDPSFSDARFNLEFARSMVQDRIDEVPEFILKTWARKISYLMNSDAWAILSLVLFAAFLAMLLLFLLGPGVGLRRTGFYSSIVLIMLSAGCYGFSVWQRNVYRRADSAVVMKPVSSVKSSPSEESSKDLFLLHEGTEVGVLDSVGKWVNISLSDGRQGWIQAGDIEVI